PLVFLHASAPTELYTRSLHDALPIFSVYRGGDSFVHRLNPVTKLAFVAAVVIAAFGVDSLWWPALLFAALVLPGALWAGVGRRLDRKSTRLNSSHVKISYAVFCLKKK